MSTEMGCLLVSDSELAVLRGNTDKLLELREALETL
jgi:hypothetical protein